MVGFLLKKYDVAVQGFPAHPYDAHSPAAARVKAWHAYCSYRHCSFKEFMTISSIKRGVDPEDYGRPIIVSGKPAFLVGRDHYVRFVFPGETTVLNSHPLDVTEAPAPLQREINNG
ncbi:hypothetical protein A6U87_14835 [Rhizobium sp. AC44/96]|uniref:hypothetical protein n=1 Tax=Rhizobium sp. AC44/96 TaxID=1841654 RepID=UPI00080F9FAF|nr:hypothetical protein [Rhizobium sp. AC44/96]OCJ05277.1 hypothetical protein A6U87_14835 [Rhizobium sp. AC44/96]